MRRLEPFQSWRLTVFQAVIVAIFLIFSLQLYQYQLVEGDQFALIADDNRLNRLPIPAPRGVIFDRYNQPMAINVPAYNVTIVPAALPDDADATLAIYNRISALTEVPPTAAIRIASGSRVRSIEEVVADGRGVQPYTPVVVAQDVPLPVAQQILEERIFMQGVDVSVASVREYPSGALTSHIIGYMGPVSATEADSLRELGFDPRFERTGYDGLEFFLGNYLEGERGSYLREIDVAGREIQVLEQIDPLPGENIRLTIDVELQQAAEQALRDQLTLVNATEGLLRTQQGVVIAMNPNTGEILAMVSLPSYDNSRFARAIDSAYYLDIAADPLRPLVNQTIRSLYPPGSVWKLITAVGVLQEGIIDPRTTLNDGGTLVLENRYAPNDPAASQTFFCWDREGHGAVDMLRGIALSCDVYFYQVGGGNRDVSESRLRPNGLGITGLFRYATAFGIGSELGVELPSELAGRMPDPDWKRRTYGENWSTGDTYNAAFGQGYVTVTPLQLLLSTTAIINDGQLLQPTLIRDFLDAEGNITRPFQPNVQRHINLETLAPNEEITLLLLEDMIMKGPTSLACLCENDADNPYYNPLRCDAANYHNTVDINLDPFITDLQSYHVFIPPNYAFNGGVCEANRFNELYQPPFANSTNLGIVREGMRETVTIGTARTANLSYVTVAGKTGTAEYCDNIAYPLGLCIPGNWPSHAWFVGYAPYENPEIAVIAFAYNGGEGSAVALPVVVKTIESYFRLKNERGATTERTIILPGQSQ
ncbi:MAG: penicillin-binding protein 2 [Phototrophicaceae bacterium]